EYSFTLLPGMYTVRAVTRDGWDPKAPASGSYGVTVAVDRTVTGLDFGMHQIGVVDLSPLWIHGDFQYDAAAGRSKAIGSILVGLKPPVGESFAPLISLVGSMWYDSRTIHADGTVT